MKKKNTQNSTFGNLKTISSKSLMQSERILDCQPEKNKTLTDIFIAAVYLNCFKHISKSINN